MGKQTESQNGEPTYPGAQPATEQGLVTVLANISEAFVMRSVL